ncbi:aspartyl aminopeptidase [Desulfocicer vacuolatum DSM 3385]|uniref:M18 family aminopeptidase n=1 Tax=Desulfocicer vacuolatum DSM 3385 TaxID=1121400 RepID=A0A1W2DAP3_9BACT|nr:M18 family aminopeptidase [Desulfocicer vacuolatum]SMC94136.1 aspartyl aminopeptidase [Desulfocicer vacuolatum DSM 3385]
MDIKSYNKNLFNFLHTAASPFHAVANTAQILTQNGFTQLLETEPWKLEKASKYFVIRNHSALIAFYTGNLTPWETGIKLCGAHTDSPSLKLKPTPELLYNTMTRLGVEVYGGALLNTWFDRGLNLAGRLILRCRGKENNTHLTGGLINLNAPVAVIPSLPIHLDREANSKKSINAQTDLPPLFLTGAFSHPGAFNEALQKAGKKIAASGDKIEEIMGFDLFFSDIQPPFFTGLNQEIISAPRLDNLLSCHAAVQSLKFARGATPCVAILADHEEVGSKTPSGAEGTFVTDTLTRMIPDTEYRLRAFAKSFMVSLDNAHALHPAHDQRYDTAHACFLNRGPVLKTNAAMRYASDAVSCALFRQLCHGAGVPMQTFVMKSDMPCGSTIGPAISSATGIRTVDVGAPTMAMHAIRELTGNTDPHALFKVLKHWFTMDEEPLLSLT